MKRKILSFILALALLSSSAYAQDYSLTFDSARELAIKNSKSIAFQKEITESISKKNDIQKENPYENKPDYEYDGITKTEVYNNTYKTYDYKKILKNVKQEEKQMIVDNEKKTLSLFIDVINDRQDLQNQNIELENTQNLVKQAELKLKKGIITKLQVDMQKSEVTKANTNIATSTKKLQLDEKKLKEHLGLEKDDNIELKLTEPSIDITLPEEAIVASEINKKEYKELKDELKEMQDDMKWIEIMYGENYQKNIDKQEKLIDKKKEDINQLRKNELQGYTKTYYDILIKANELELKKIDKAQLELQKKKIVALNKKGRNTKNEINKIDAQINANILSQNKKALEIRHLTFNYNKDIIL